MLVVAAWETLWMSGTIHSEGFDFRGAYSLADLIYIGRPVVEIARSWAKAKVSVVNAPVGS